MPKLFPAPQSRHGAPAFTLMEILVVIAIILVIAAIAFPAYLVVQKNAHRTYAANNMRQLGAACLTFASQNDNYFPNEDSKGKDTWQNAAKEENAKAWYNALPKILGQKSVGEFALNPRDYYTKQNILFLPGATYPDTDKKLVQPLFAIAVNTKLQRKDPDDATAKKEPLKINSITDPARTVMFLEQGLPSESKTFDVQANKDYDGSPKGSAKSFVGRYGGQGVLIFMDGHSEIVNAKDLLTETGRFPFPVSSSGILWTRTPEEDPNKN
jgi:prepilin-type N-terminal cleavage/methylation domain-containing protein